jgi:1-aminocyclopropane-1-carboxylate deaminase/D-cysteine desulfhydrase-like pyridoxal-dependent ACC family enzyme
MFPQPQSRTARDNLNVALARLPIVDLPHWSALPFAMWQAARRDREQSLIMPPGGANVVGALGYVSAALEVVAQVARGEAPAPRLILTAVGSTCTSAGLLLGFSLAVQHGLCREFRDFQLRSVRVTPWPITSPRRIAWLAHRTARFFEDTCGLSVPSYGELLARLSVDGNYLGQGYGMVTEAGARAIGRFDAFGRAALDTTYSAKSAAALLDLVERRSGPVLYWATKSGVPLPDAEGATQPGAARAARWLVQGMAQARGAYD